MNELVEKIGLCVEHGKVDKASPYPATMKGLEGADEFTRGALAQGVGPEEILQSCIGGMARVGDKFGRNEVFLPEMLMAAKAMKAATAHLKPFFRAGSVHARGTVVIGTVAGDLHDIGKNLVSMFIEGNGWNVIDLGVDVKPSKFIDKIKAHPECVVGLSALLTTTIASMQKTVQEIRSHFPETRIIVGGAPMTHAIAMGMGASAYARDPQGAVAWLSELKSAT